MPGPRPLPLVVQPVLAVLTCVGGMSVAELTGSPWPGLAAAFLVSLGGQLALRRRRVPLPRPQPDPDWAARGRARRAGIRVVHDTMPVLAGTVWIIVAYYALQATGWHGPAAGEAEAYELVPLAVGAAAWLETEQRMDAWRGRRREWYEG